jgi:hypothetical protein
VRDVLKAILLALLVATGPIEGRLLYVCHATDMKAGDCCGDHVGQGEHIAFSPSCAHEAAPGAGFFCMEPAAHADAVPSAAKSPLEADSARGPPLPLGPPPPEILFSLPLATSNAAAVPAVAPTPFGADTYLLTLRLRI